MSLVKDKNGIYISEKNRFLSYPDTGHDSCYELEAKSFWFNHRNKIIERIIAEKMFSNNYADVGGGNGFQALYLSKIFKDRKTFLIEPGYQGCLNAKERGLENVYNIGIEEFDLKANKIDGIGLYDVVEHIKDDESFLKKIYNLSEIGTLIYITVPAYKFLWAETDDINGHYKRYTRKSISKTAKNAGFKVIRSSYFFSFLPVLVFLLRGVPYRLGIRKGAESINKSETDNHSGGFFDFF